MVQSSRFLVGAALSKSFEVMFQNIVPFGIMVLVLLLRPQGLAGRPLGFDLPPLRAELRKLIESVSHSWRRLRG